MTAGARDLWVFAYGSLMWRPGFPFADSERARLFGHHRSFCVYSVHHRGSPRRPGLVLGLDRGGACEGIAYRVAGQDADAVLAGLRRREQVTAVYREALAPVTLARRGGEEVLAVAYLVERRHPAYAGVLPLVRQARLIRSGHGLSGANIDYFASTLSHLRSLGIRDRPMERLRALLGGSVARDGPGESNFAVTPRPRPVVTAAPAWAPRFRPGELRRFAYRARLRSLHAIN